jgi:hypothetical protein
MLLENRAMLEQLDKEDVEDGDEEFDLDEDEMEAGS